MKISDFIIEEHVTVIEAMQKLDFVQKKYYLLFQITNLLLL